MAEKLVSFCSGLEFIHAGRVEAFAVRVLPFVAPSVGFIGDGGIISISEVFWFVEYGFRGLRSWKWLLRETSQYAHLVCAPIDRSIDER